MHTLVGAAGEYPEDEPNMNMPIIPRGEMIRAREYSKTHGVTLAAALIALGRSTNEAYEAMAMDLRVPFVDLRVFRPDATAIAIMPETIARNYGVLGLKRDGKILYVAMSDIPGSNVENELSLATGCKIRAVIAESAEITRVLNEHYSSEAQ